MPKARPAWAPLALAALAAAVYWNTLQAQFAFDDTFAVVRRCLRMQQWGRALG
jgi:hypothetical protein